MSENYKQYTIAIDTNWCGTNEDYKVIYDSSKIHILETWVDDLAYDNFISINGPQLIADEEWDGEVPEDDDDFDIACDTAYTWDIDELYVEDELLYESYDGFNDNYIVNIPSFNHTYTYRLPTNIVWNDQFFTKVNHNIQKFEGTLEEYFKLEEWNNKHLELPEK